MMSCQPAVQLSSAPFTEAKRNYADKLLKKVGTDKNVYKVLFFSQNTEELRRELESNSSSDFPSLLLFKTRRLDDDLNSANKARYLFKRSTRLEFIVRPSSGNLQRVVIHKLRAYIDKNRFLDLSEHPNEKVKEMSRLKFEWTSEAYTLILSVVEKESLLEKDLNDIMTLSLSERIAADHFFDTLNAEELALFYGKERLLPSPSSGKLLPPLLNEEKYDNLDIDNCFSVEESTKLQVRGELIIKVRFIDGQELLSNLSGKDIKERCKQLAYDLLYPSNPYHGCQKVWYGYPSLRQHDNFLCIVIVPEELMLKLHLQGRLMFIHYCVDDGSFAGRYVLLRIKFFDNFISCWENLEETEKCLLLRSNCPSEACLTPSPSQVKLESNMDCPDFPFPPPETGDQSK